MASLVETAACKAVLWSLVRWGVLGFIALWVPCVHGQASATLAVQVNLQSSISLVFQTAPGGCTLDNSGTNNVGLYLGYAVFSGGGTYSGCGSMVKLNSGRYQVSTPFQIVVNKANSSSPNYRLSAWLAAAPPTTDISWVLNPDGNGNGTVLTTAQQYYEAANAYGTRTEVLAIQVKNPVAQQMLVSTIYYMATAN